MPAVTVDSLPPVLPVVEPMSTLQATNTKTNAQAEVKVRPSSAGGGAAADDGGGAGGAGGGSKAGSDGDSIGPALGMRAMPGPVITLPLPFSSMLPTLFF